MVGTCGQGLPGTCRRHRVRAQAGGGDGVAQLAGESREFAGAWRVLKKSPSLRLSKEVRSSIAWSRLDRFLLCSLNNPPKMHLKRNVFI